MDILWAPWRLKYIVDMEKPKKCVLCVGTSKKNDRRRFIVKRSRHSFSILNAYPYNNGHLMVAPYRHVSRIEDLSPEETADLVQLVFDMKRLLDKCVKPHGYNIGLNLGRASGAGIDKHIHIHIVPRWEGDTNFMPVLGKTKVISESLRGFYKRITKK
jgi:ATP adenylyltransferase